MRKLRASREFRILFSEKLMDLGNLAIAALVLGQFLGENEFSMLLFFVGFLIMALCYIISFVVSLERK